MEIENIELRDLNPYGKNARTHSKNQVSQIAKSIEKFGFNTPILIDELNEVIAGHGRLLAATKLGLESIPCVRLGHMSKKQVKAFRIADNSLALNSEWDFDLLKTELEELDNEDFDVELLGLENLDDLLPPVENPFEGDPDEIPEVDENTHNVSIGQIWKLGDHRLMCGDSTDKDTVDKLMNGEKADMVFTDPPYGISHDTEYKKRIGTKLNVISNTKNYKKIIGDKDYNPSHIFEFFGYVEEVFLWGADYYAEYIPDRNEGAFIVWDKHGEINGKALFGSEFELCWSKHKYRRELFQSKWMGIQGLSTEDTKKRVHPTQKPVLLIEKMFNKLIKDETVNTVDLFLGSGSTLIACEKTNRKCYGMELDPHYCSVIIERWQKYTGQKAELIDG